MLWEKGEPSPEEGTSSGGAHPEPIRVQRDAPRPATILRVATELEERGAEILELFKEVRGPLGEVALPIHLLRDGTDVFVEVETGPWDPRNTEEAINKAAVLRGSEYAEAEFELLSAYPVPREIQFFFARSRAALLQLALTGADPERPEHSAALLREVAGRQWAVDLDYEPGYLPLVEELLRAAFDEHEAPPILDALVVGLGSFVGETIRQTTGYPGAWRPDEGWGEGPVLEVGWLVLDPIGKARAFLLEGTEDSIAFYAAYVLELLARGPEEG